GRLKAALPQFIGKPLHIPEGATVDDEGGEGQGEEGAPQTDTSTPPAKSGLNASELQAAMNKLAPAIKSVVESKPEKKKELHDLVAAFAEQIKTNKLETAAGTLATLASLLKSLGAVVESESPEAKAKTDFE